MYDERVSKPGMTKTGLHLANSCEPLSVCQNVGGGRPEDSYPVSSLSDAPRLLRLDEFEMAVACCACSDVLAGVPRKLFVNHCLNTMNSKTVARDTSHLNAIILGVGVIILRVLSDGITVRYLVPCDADGNCQLHVMNKVVSLKPFHMPVSQVNDLLKQCRQPAAENRKILPAA